MIVKKIVVDLAILKVATTLKNWITDFYKNWLLKVILKQTFAVLILTMFLRSFQKVLLFLGWALTDKKNVF